MQTNNKICIGLLSNRGFQQEMVNAYGKMLNYSAKKYDLHFEMAAFPECLKRIVEHYEGCPACILAEIRQAGMTSCQCNFDFDACCTEWRNREKDGNE